jgi:hypothetical protein
MIRHFQSEANTMRRCEELPWHLQICHKWHVLKDTLVDLKTFEMMFTSSELKGEILAYWLLLTEGPMYITDDHRTGHAAGKGGLEAHDPTEGQDEILSALDTTAVLGLTLREQKKQKYKNQVHNGRNTTRFNNVPHRCRRQFFVVVSSRTASQPMT